MLLNLLLTISALAAGASGGDGVIEGTVVRRADQTLVPGAEVVLRLKTGDELLPLAETVADARGRFRFDGLSAKETFIYLPGANYQGIHYPGPSVRLSPIHRRAEVRLTVCAAVGFPNPLVVRSHTVTLRPDTGVLRVTESLVLDNPSPTCYVGQAAGQLAEPVTLQLSIPANFERVTFANEFFGRRFSLVGGRLVTGAPWPPGERELSFSYVVPCTRGYCVWKRPLDLPTTQMRVSACNVQPSQATCNLSRGVPTGDGTIVFAAADHALDTGYAVQVELGRVPLSPMAYAPAGALVTLVGLIFVTLRCRSKMPLATRPAPRTES
jgi:hypothetical protein